MTYKLTVLHTGKAHTHQAYLCVAAIFEALCSVVMHYYHYSHLNSGNTWTACPTVKYCLVFSHNEKRGMTQQHIYSSDEARLRSSCLPVPPALLLVTPGPPTPLGSAMQLSGGLRNHLG